MPAARAVPGGEWEAVLVGAATSPGESSDFAPIDVRPRAAAAKGNGTPAGAFAPSPLAYAERLRLPNGSYRVHVNLGLIPPAQTQPAFEVDPWRSVRAALDVFRSRPVDKEAIASALGTAEWFLANRRPDGSPPPRFWLDHMGNVLATSETDAYDSAYAGLLDLAHAVYEAAPGDPDVAAFLDANRAALFNVAYKLVSLTDADGLTWTYPPESGNSYRAKLMAGNSESFDALTGWVELVSKYYRDPLEASYYQSFATNLHAGIMRDLYDPATGLFHILKGVSGAVQPLQATPNWDAWDKYETYPIQYGVVAANSAIAKHVVHALLQRHPGILTEKPGTALTHSPEFGEALWLVGLHAEARQFARTVLDAQFPPSGPGPDGYFMVDDAAKLARLQRLVR